VTRSARASEALRAAVREHYGTIADANGARDRPLGPGCCGSADGPGSGTCGRAGSPCCAEPARAGSPARAGDFVALGYTAEDRIGLPPEADLGLGCGNPSAFASLRRGETVLDLGSGAGIDCFVAARKVGPRGRVIGVDMTPAMVERARANARRGPFGNVEFRLGEIEHLPVADRSVDVVVSNCVINLSPEKERVYREAYRALRPGGRLAISDVVAARRSSTREREDVARWSGCAAGAIPVGALRQLLRRVGFANVRVDRPAPGASAELPVGPASVVATKPGR